MTSGAKILLIEDDAGIMETLRRVLVDEGHEVVSEKRGDDGLARASKDAFNAVITDLKLPGLTGLELVRQLHRAQPRLPIILVTAFGTTDTAIEATKFGAYDYLLKPFNLPNLLETVRKAADSNRLMSEPVALGEANGAHDALIGKSAAMQAIYKEIGRVASRPVNVLIRGETGTGKELIARALYQHSDRTHAPFIAINCAAIPETLLESELFGHERGAFTGAEARRIGRFEQADHGTIFLDEIGDMTLGTQVKLMRVLQEKCIQRVGGKETISVDVRVVAATHRHLETAIQQKHFREDLYYRLSVMVITLPPLRNRPEDIPQLVHYFLQKHGPALGNPGPSIHPQAMELLQAQTWPGNVRELENMVRKTLLLAQSYTINVDHVSLALSKSPAPPPPATQSLREYVDNLIAAARRDEFSDVHARVLETAERELFTRAIEQAHGNQAKAARWLGISRLTMKAKLVQFGLHPSQDCEPARSGGRLPHELKISRNPLLPMDPDYVRLISTPRKAIVLQEITPRLRDFIAQHKLPEPKRVVYRPLEFCEYKRCFVNVDKQVGKMGGAPIAGWLFWEIQNTALQTEAHCIWASPEGAWIDITPQHPTPRRLIFSADDRVADKRGYTVGYETPLTNNEKVLALQKFTRALARIRERHVNGFGSEVLIPMHLLWEAARNSDLPADVAGFLCQKSLSWEESMAQKYQR